MSAAQPNPFRYFNSSSEVIRLLMMMYVKYPLSLRRPRRAGIIAFAMGSTSRAMANARARSARVYAAGARREAPRFYEGENGERAVFALNYKGVAKTRLLNDDYPPKSQPNGGSVDSAALSDSDAVGPDRLDVQR